MAGFLTKIKNLIKSVGSSNTSYYTHSAKEGVSKPVSSSVDTLKSTALKGISAVRKGTQKQYDAYKKYKEETYPESSITPKTKLGYNLNRMYQYSTPTKQKEYLAGLSDFNERYNRFGGINNFINKTDPILGKIRPYYTYTPEYLYYSKQLQDPEKATTFSAYVAGVDILDENGHVIPGSYNLVVNKMHKDYADLLPYAKAMRDVNKLFSGEFTYGLTQEEYEQWVKENTYTRRVYDYEHKMWTEVQEFKPGAVPPPFTVDANGKKPSDYGLDFENSWAFFVAFMNSQTSFNNAAASRAIEEMAHTAGADTRAADSFLDVIRDALAGNKNIISGMSDYLTDYIFNPLSKGSFKQLGINMLWNVGETLDYAAVAGRAAISTVDTIGDLNKNNTHLVEGQDQWWSDSVSFVEQSKFIELGALRYLDNEATIDAFAEKLRNEGNGDLVEKWYAFAKDYNEEFKGSNHSSAKEIFAAIKKAYTDKEKGNYLFDTGSTLADTALYMIDPTLIIGSKTKTIGKEGVKLAVKFAVEDVLRNTDAVKFASGTVYDFMKSSFADRFIKSIGTDVLTKNPNLIEDSLLNFMKQAHRAGLIVDEVPADISNAIVKNISDYQSRFIKGVYKTGTLIDALDSSVLKSTLALPYLTYKLPITAYKKLRKTSGFVSEKILSKWLSGNRKSEEIFGNKYGSRSIGNLSEYLENTKKVAVTESEADTDTIAMVVNTITEDAKKDARTLEYNIRNIKSSLSGSKIDVETAKEQFDNLISDITKGQVTTVSEFRVYLDSVFAKYANDFPGLLDDIKGIYESQLKEIDRILSVSRSRIVEDLAKDVLKFTDFESGLSVGTRLQRLQDLGYELVPGTEEMFTKRLYEAARSGEIEPETSLDALYYAKPSTKSYTEAVKLRESIGNYLYNYVDPYELEKLSDEFFEYVDGTPELKFTDGAIDFDDVANKFHGIHNLRNYLAEVGVEDVDYFRLATYIDDAQKDLVVHRVSHPDELGGLVDILRRFSDSLFFKVPENDLRVMRLQMDKMEVFNELVNNPAILSAFDTLFSEETAIGRLFSNLDNLTDEQMLDELFKSLRQDDSTFSFSQDDYEAIASDFQSILTDLKLIKNDIDTIQEYGLFYRTITEECGLTKDQAHIVLDTVFGFYDYFVPEVLHKNSSFIRHVADKLTYGLDAVFGESLALDTFRKTLLDWDNEIYKKYFDKIEDPAELEAYKERIIKLCEDAHKSPLADVRVQMLQVILRSDEAVEVYNRTATGGKPVIFYDIETTGLIPNNTKMTSIAFLEWEQIPEDADLDTILKAVENRGEEYIAPLLHDEIFNNRNIDFLSTSYLEKLYRDVAPNASRRELLELYAKEFGVSDLTGHLTEQDLLSIFLKKADAENTPCFVAHNNNNFDRNVLKNRLFQNNMFKFENTNWDILCNESKNSFELLHRAFGSYSLNSEQLDRVLEAFIKFCNNTSSASHKFNVFNNSNIIKSFEKITRKVDVLNTDIAEAQAKLRAELNPSRRIPTTEDSIEHYKSEDLELESNYISEIDEYFPDDIRSPKAVSDAVDYVAVSNRISDTTVELLEFQRSYDPDIVDFMGDAELAEHLSAQSRVLTNFCDALEQLFTLDTALQNRFTKIFVSDTKELISRIREVTSESFDTFVNQSVEFERVIHDSRPNTITLKEYIERYMYDSNTFRNDSKEIEITSDNYVKSSPIQRVSSLTSFTHSKVAAVPHYEGTPLSRVTNATVDKYREQYSVPEEIDDYSLRDIIEADIYANNYDKVFNEAYENINSIQSHITNVKTLLDNRLSENNFREYERTVRELNRRRRELESSDLVDAMSTVEDALLEHGISMKEFVAMMDGNLSELSHNTKALLAEYIYQQNGNVPFKISGLTDGQLDHIISTAGYPLEDLAGHLIFLLDEDLLYYLKRKGFNNLVTHAKRYLTLHNDIDALEMSVKDFRDRLDAFNVQAIENSNTRIVVQDDYISNVLYGAGPIDFATLTDEEVDMLVNYSTREQKIDYIKSLDIYDKDVFDAMSTYVTDTWLTRTVKEHPEGYYDYLAKHMNKGLLEDVKSPIQDVTSYNDARQYFQIEAANIHKLVQQNKELLSKIGLTDLLPKKLVSAYKYLTYRGENLFKRACRFTGSDEQYKVLLEEIEDFYKRYEIYSTVVQFAFNPDKNLLGKALEYSKEYWDTFKATSNTKNYLYFLANVDSAFRRLSDFRTGDLELETLDKIIKAHFEQIDAEFYIPIERSRLYYLSLLFPEDQFYFSKFQKPKLKTFLKDDIYVGHSNARDVFKSDFNLADYIIRQQEEAKMYDTTGADYITAQREETEQKAELYHTLYGKEIPPAQPSALLPRLSQVPDFGKSVNMLYEGITDASFTNVLNDLRTGTRAVQSKANAIKTFFEDPWFNKGARFDETPFGELCKDVFGKDSDKYSNMRKVFENMTDSGAGASEEFNSLKLSKYFDIPQNSRIRLKDATSLRNFYERVEYNVLNRLRRNELIEFDSKTISELKAFVDYAKELSEPLSTLEDYAYLKYLRTDLEPYELYAVSKVMYEDVFKWSDNMATMNVGNLSADEVMRNRLNNFFEYWEPEAHDWKLLNTPSTYYDESLRREGIIRGLLGKDVYEGKYKSPLSDSTRLLLDGSVDDVIFKPSVVESARETYLKKTNRVGYEDAENFRVQHAKFAQREIGLNTLLGELEGMKSTTRDMYVSDLNLKFRKVLETVLDELNDDEYSLFSDYMRKVQNQRMEVSTRQVLDYITESEDNLISHLLFYDQHLVIPLKYDSDVKKLVEIVKKSDKDVFTYSFDTEQFYLGLNNNRRLTSAKNKDGSRNLSFELTAEDRANGVTFKKYNQPKYDYVGFESFIDYGDNAVASEIDKLKKNIPKYRDTLDDLTAKFSEIDYKVSTLNLDRGNLDIWLKINNLDSNTSKRSLVSKRYLKNFADFGNEVSDIYGDIYNTKSKALDIRLMLLNENKAAIESELKRFEGVENSRSKLANYRLSKEKASIQKQIDSTISDKERLKRMKNSELTIDELVKERDELQSEIEFAQRTLANAESTMNSYTESLYRVMFTSDEVLRQFDEIHTTLNYYSDNAINGAIGTLQTPVRRRAVYNALPVEFKNNLYNRAFYEDPDNFNVFEYDMSILGDVESRFKHTDYNESDLILTTQKVIEELSGRVQAENVYLHSLFNKDNPSNFAKLFDGYSDKEIIEQLNNTPEFVVVTAQASKETPSGVVIKDIDVYDELACKIARESNAIVVTYETYLDMVNTFNFAKAKNSAFLKAWSKCMLVMKVGHLSNPGTWLRNWIDATIKAAGDTGDVGNTARYQLTATKMIYEYNKILKVINTEKRSPYHSKREVRTHWEAYAAASGTKLTYEEFTFLDEWMQNGLSGGESTSMKALRKKQEAYEGINVGLKPTDGNKNPLYNRNLVEDLPVRFRDLGEAEVSKYINSVNFRDYSISKERFMEIYNNPELVLSTYEKNDFNAIAMDVIRARARALEPVINKFSRACSTIFNAALSPMSLVEEIVRLGEYLALQDKGYTRNKILQTISASQFNYDLKTIRARKLENVFLYYTFEKSNMIYWLNQLSENPMMLRTLEILWGSLSWDPAYDYVTDEQDPFNNASLAYMMLNGGIPIGDKGLYLKISPSFLSALNYFYSGPEALLSAVAAPIELLSKFAMTNMGIDYRTLFGTMSEEFMDEPAWLKALGTVPIIGTVYDRTFAPRHVRNTWARVLDTDFTNTESGTFRKLWDNMIKGNLAPMANYILPSVFGTALLSNNADYSNFESFQRSLALQNKWYDANLGKVVDLSQYNTVGLNNPDLSWDQLVQLKLAMTGKVWDNNKREFVIPEEYEWGGLNRKFDWNDPAQFAEMCDLHYTKFGEVWDANQSKWVLPKDYIEGGLNTPNLTWEEKCYYMYQYFEVQWDNNQQKFVDKNHYLEGGLNGNIKFGDAGTEGYTSSASLDWNTLCAYKYALHGEVWDHDSHSWVKVAEPVIDVSSAKLISTGNAKKLPEAKSLPFITSAYAVDKLSNASAERDLSKTLTTYDASHNQKVFNWIVSNYSNVGGANPSKRYKSGWADGYHYKANRIYPNYMVNAIKPYNKSHKFRNNAYNMVYSYGDNASTSAALAHGDRAYYQYYNNTKVNSNTTNYRTNWLVMRTQSLIKREQSMLKYHFNIYDTTSDKKMSAKNHLNRIKTIWYTR